MFNSSIQVELRCLTQVLKLSQNVNMKTRLDDQFNLVNEIKKIEISKSVLIYVQL